MQARRALAGARKAGAACLPAWRAGGVRAGSGRGRRAADRPPLAQAARPDSQALRRSAQPSPPPSSHPFPPRQDFPKGLPEGARIGFTVVNQVGWVAI